MKATLMFTGDGPVFMAEAATTQQVFDDMRQALKRRWALTRTTSVVFVKLDEESQLAGSKAYMVYVSGSPVLRVRITWEGITYYPMDEDEREVAVPYVENPDEVE